LVAAAKFLVEATKISFVIPNFVAVTKPFFCVGLHLQRTHRGLTSKKKILKAETFCPFKKY